MFIKVSLFMQNLLAQYLKVEVKKLWFFLIKISSTLNMWFNFFCQSKATAPPNQPSPVHLAFSHFKTFFHKNFLSVPEAILPTEETHFLHWNKTFPSSFPLTFFSFLYNPNKKKSKRKKKKNPTLLIFLISITFYVPIIICFFRAFPTTNIKIVYKSYTRKEKKKT